jgi:membrane protein DedA with SNARE-associated domain
MEADTDRSEDDPHPEGFRLRSQDLIWVVVFAAIVFALRFAPIGGARDVSNYLDWPTKQGLKLTKHLFESYGYATIFLAPMAENTLFLGALIPGTLVMLLAGISAHDGLINIWPAIPLGVAGAIIGDTISYGIGRFGWHRLGAENRLARWAEPMREPLLSNSMWLVLSYHFAGYSRMVGPAAAGFLRMPFRRWMLLDYVGVSIWVIVYLTIGYVLGAFGLSLDSSDRNVRIFEIMLFGLFVVGIFSIFRAARKRERPVSGEGTD